MKLGFKPRSLLKGKGIFFSLSTSLMFEQGLQEEDLKKNKLGFQQVQVKGEAFQPTGTAGVKAWGIRQCSGC